jgi:hypothetical protein
MNKSILIIYTYQHGETGRMTERQYTLEEVEEGAHRLWLQGNWNIIRRELAGSRASQIKEEIILNNLRGADGHHEMPKVKVNIIKDSL